MRNLGNLGNLEGTLGTFTWEPLLGNLGTFTWEPGNLYLGTFTWEPGNLYLGTWEPLLGNLYLGTWEPLLGNLYLEPGNLGGMGFGAAPVCSETVTMAEDPKAFCCWGKINGSHRDALFMQFQFRCLDSKPREPLPCILGKLETFTLYPWKA